jgi:hypothetical protein
VIIGHEFRRKIEVSLEVYDQKTTSGPVGKPSARESTLGIGGRIPVTKGGSVWFIAMAGRSLATVTRTNDQPSWIASVGFQILSGRRRRYSSD